MIEKKKPVGAVLLAGILLLSAFMMPMSPGGVVDSGNESATPTATAVQGSVQQFDTGSMAMVPDSHIRELSTQETETPPRPSDVRASAGSQTMQVETTTVDGKPALVLRDDRTHDGRWVSVSTTWLEEVHGTVPEAVTIAHEDGDTYTSQLQVKEDSAAFYVEEFSVNTVTFSGEVVINGDPAGDGAQYTYDIADLDSASNVTVNLTGVNSTQWDNQTASVSPSESYPISIDGTTAPLGPSSNNRPTLTLAGTPAKYDVFRDEGHSSSANRKIAGDRFNDNPVSSEYRVEPDTSVTVDKIQVEVSGVIGSDYGATVDVYHVPSEKPDATYQEGTKIATWDPDYSTGWQTISLDNSVTFDGGQNHTLEFVTSTTDSDGNNDFIQIAADGSPSGGIWSSQHGSTQDDSGHVRLGVPSSATDLSVTDGEGATVSFGNISSEDTVTKEIPLSTASSQLNISSSTGSGTLDLTLRAEEVTETTDAGVELNGQNVNHTGTLADGETVSLTIDESHIQQGTNTVNVSVGDGTLSGDAPPSQVGLELRHDASDRQSVTYAAEQWTSRYNVSKTYASDRANAKLTIPFDSSEVVSMRAVEYRINETGGWTPMSTANYGLDGTTLEANLSDAYGGTIPAGSTVEVRANASKINPINGTVTIVEATAVGQDLNTKIEVNSVTSGFRIESPNQRVHYAHDASYETAAYWVADQQGQRLHLPSATSGDTVRVSRMPVSVVAQSGDVHVTAANTSATEPAIAVEPGQAGGNAVEYTFEEAQADTEYSLFSTTNNVVRDSGTASSPLTLTDDDSAETLKFMLSQTGETSGSSSGGSTGGVVGVFDAPTDDTDWLPLIGVALALAGLVVASRNSDGVTQAGSNTAEGIEGALDGIPVLGPAVGRLLGGTIRSGSQLVRAGVENRTIALALGSAIAWGAVQFGIVELPAGSVTVIIVAGVAILSFVGLREYGEFQIGVWAGIVTATAATAAIVTSDADPVAAVVQSDILPLIAIGALYVGYRGVKAFQAGQTTEIVLETDGGED